MDTEHLISNVISTRQNNYNNMLTFCAAKVSFPHFDYLVKYMYVNFERKPFSLNFLKGNFQNFHSIFSFINQ